MRQQQIDRLTTWEAYKAGLVKESVGTVIELVVEARPRRVDLEVIVQRINTMLQQYEAWKHQRGGGDHGLQGFAAWYRLHVLSAD